ncbi:MAG: hypothetical protein HS115_13430 [Spirochaetales bacterium]|nr:hypothetical protein [Spirochaetales bacterium]
MNYRTLFYLFFLASAFSGCGSLGFQAAYSQADTLALLRIQSFFDLNSSQRSVVRSRLKDIHGWHRSTEMPVYALFLREVDRNSRDRLTEGEVTTAWGKVQSFYNRLWSRLIVAGSPILATLSEEQINHLEGKLQDSTRDLEKELSLPPAERLKKRQERARKSVAEWLGPVDAQQGKELDRIVAGFPDNGQLYLRYSRERKAQFVQLLRDRRPPAEIQRTLLNWTVHREAHYPSYYRGINERWVRDFARAALEFDRTITAEQRQHLTTKLQDYIAFCESQSPGRAALLSLL